MRYQLFSVQYARRNYMHPAKPIGSAMRLVELADKLEAVGYSGFNDWYVKDTLKDVYVDPAVVRTITNVTIEGDGYPECPCCASFGASHADHTKLPNCLAK